MTTLTVTGVLAARRFILDFHLHNTLNLTLAQSRHTLRTLEVVDRLLMDLADGVAASSPDVTLRMIARSHGLPHIRKVEIYEKTGRYRGAVFEGPPLLHAAPAIGSDEPFFAPHVAGDLDHSLLGLPERDANTNEPLLRISRRVTGPQGEFLGVVVARLSPLPFDELFEALELGHEARMALMRAPNLLIARSPARPELFGGVIGPVSTMPDEVDDDVSIWRRTFGVVTPHQAVQAVQRRVPGYPLIIAAAIPHETMLAQWRIWGVVCLGAAAAFDLLVLVLLLMFRRQMKRESAHGRELRRMLRTDPVTGLANRSAAIACLKSYTQPADMSDRELRVAYIDFDSFKAINDTYGHAVGDDILRSIAIRGEAASGPMDLFSRLGGDEFLFVSPGPIEKAGAMAQALSSALSGPHSAGGMPLLVRPSIGIACYPRDTRDPEELLRFADLAMYENKRSRIGPYAECAPDQLAMFRRARDVEHQLRRNLHANAMRLALQPKAMAATRSVIGFEALARWPTPDISPGEFISVAEQSGLIGELGDWCMGVALRQIATLRRSGSWPEGGRMAINLSAAQLLDGRLPERVATLSQEAGVALTDFEVEVTETRLLQDIDTSCRVLGALRDMGISVAVDDFGTGYSSLSYLQRLPVDVVKLDRTFVAHLPGQPTDRAIPRAVIRLGHSLGLKVCAEGVENEAAWQWLVDHGCDQIQGFWFARPMWLEDIAPATAA